MNFFVKSFNILIRIPAMSALLLIWLYRNSISRVLPPACRYYPSCSSYAMEAFKKYGAFRGFILSIYRIVRCNPFSKGGFDPVPDRFIN